MRAFVLGAIAAGVLAYTAATAVAIAVAASGGTVALALGSVVIVAVERTGADGSVTTLGPGLLALAIAGGLVNASAAAVLSARRRRRGA